MASITERTREIGTRKALGATNGSIRLQFVVESVILCLVGGAIGVAAGVGLGAMGANLLGYAASPSIASIAVAELADARDLKSLGGNIVPVRSRSAALAEPYRIFR